MVPGADGDAGAVEDFGHVVGVELIERETDDSRLVLGTRPRIRRPSMFSRISWARVASSRS